MNLGRKHDQDSEKNKQLTKFFMNENQKAEVVMRSIHKMKGNPCPVPRS
jgi:hypothetical protein